MWLWKGDLLGPNMDSSTTLKHNHETSADDYLSLNNCDEQLHFSHFVFFLFMVNKTWFSRGLALATQLTNKLTITVNVFFKYIYLNQTDEDALNSHSQMSAISQLWQAYLDRPIFKNNTYSNWSNLVLGFLHLWTGHMDQSNRLSQEVLFPLRYNNENFLPHFEVIGSAKQNYHKDNEPDDDGCNTRCGGNTVKAKALSIDRSDSSLSMKFKKLFGSNPETFISTFPSSSQFS